MSRSLPTLLAALTITVAAPAMAQVSFTPVTPATCPSWTEVPWTYTVNSSGWELPEDPNASGNYINNIFAYRDIVASPAVRDFGFRLDSFDTEASFDFLYYGQPNATPTALTGMVSSGWRDFSIRTAAEDRGGYMLFRTDYSVTRPGFAIGRARVCGDGVQRNGIWGLTPMRRASGFLLGQNDVVYLRAVLGSYKAGDSCTSTHDTFSVWGQGGDFDVYARCGALPTPTTYSVAGLSGDAQEHIEIQPGLCPCNSAVYLAVHAYSGSGSFNIVHNKHYATKHQPIANGAVMCAAPAATYQTYRSEFVRGFKRFFGSTEGSIIRDTLQMKNNATAGFGAMVRYRCFTGRPNAGRCSGDVEMFSDFFDAETLSHELGHHLLCVGDEYEDGKGTECGHSIMGNQWAQSNMCHCSNWGAGSPDASGRCAQNAGGGHSRDPTPPNISATNEGPVWTNMLNGAHSPNSVTETPDMFSYETFDFNGMYFNVVDL